MQLHMCKDVFNLLLKRTISKSLSRSCATVGPMLQLQDKLPRLPVPPLETTLQKYLLSVKPLLNEDDYTKTENMVREFGKPNGQGHTLHQLLMERANKTENWLSNWWLKGAYLEFRMPVIVHSSPGMVYPHREFRSVQDHIVCAANVIDAAIAFKNKIDTQKMPVDMAGSAPMDMSQYQKIFSTCRIPQLPHDRLEYFSEDPEPPKHIVVARNNHYFKLDVYGNDGVPLNAQQLESHLREILKQSQHETHPIGMLSTEHRDTWAEAYQRLCTSKLNRKSVKLIQQSIFLLCLDKTMTNTVESNKMTKGALQTIHGGGASMNSGNRWFDKTVQLIIGEDGTLGFTYEHSPAEGPPVANLMDYIADHVDKPGKHSPPSSSINPPEKLEFELSPESLNDIKEAEKNLNILINDLDMTCFTYPVYGREFIKQQKLGPDSYIQMAIQLAYYRLHSCIAATYESASLRKFLYGRTETIRSASIEGLEFCRQMMHTSSTASTKVAALKLAIDSHKNYITRATNGLGVDRLLFGLKRVAIENGMKVPDILSDKGFTTSTHFQLSTSQVPARGDAVMCYGPLVTDGYGCCYNPRARSINFGVSAFNSNTPTLSSKYKEALENSLTEMHDILILTQSSKL